MQSSILSILFFPELILSLGTIFVLLFSLFVKKNSFKISSNLSILVLIIVGFITFFEIDFLYNKYLYFFKDSSFITFFQFLVILGSVLTLIITFNFNTDLKLLRFEIPILILFATLGMLVLIGSNNLMTMYLGIELQSLSLYVLASIKRDSLKSSESGIKYFVLGALSSGILLYGCSLIYGFTGETNFEEIFLKILVLEKLNLGIIFGLVFILVGLSFKISAVPFHMWTPDVYEGVPTSVTAFFAIVPKVAGIALIYRFCLEIFGSFHQDWAQIIIFLSITSMFLGSITAIKQTSIKRLLAYSSIGHVGYVLIGLVSANVSGIKGASIYMFIYLMMNISLFTIILSLKVNNKYVESISDLSGLSKVKPVYSICIAIIMLSMAGIPPFAGFFGKFYIFISAIEADLLFLAIAGVLSSVIAAFYYLRIIKVIYFDELQYDSHQTNISFKSSLILLFSMIVITLFVFFPSILTNIASNIGNDFF